MDEETIIEIVPIPVSRCIVTIQGDSDLVLNKMDEPTKRQLIDIRKDKAKSIEKPDYWDKVITSIHWRDGNPKEFSEKSLVQALKENAPCITAFGMKRSLCQAVVRCGLDKYSTKFDSGVNIIAPKQLIPVEFVEHRIEEDIMTPKKSSPILATLNVFSNWKAKFEIACLDNTCSIPSVVNIINLAGFGIGIGSGRTSGYGRYHVVDVASIVDA